MNIDLNRLSSGIMGLTTAFGNFLLEACAVCLDNQGHATGVNYSLSGTNNSNCILNWNAVVNQQVKRNWNDLEEATEYGATAIAILLAEQYSGQKCIERSSKGTGFDYWLGEEDSLGLFQQKARLEISGILEEKMTNTVTYRSNQKIKQTTASAGTGLKAHICVTEFKSPKGQYTII